MNRPDAELFNRNPKIDRKVVSAAGTLQKKLPEDAKQKQGSDYRISPALGGQALMLSSRGKRV